MVDALALSREWERGGAFRGCVGARRRWQRSRRAKDWLLSCRWTLLGFRDRVQLDLAYPSDGCLHVLLWPISASRVGAEGWGVNTMVSSVVTSVLRGMPDTSMGAGPHGRLMLDLVRSLTVELPENCQGPVLMFLPESADGVEQ